MLLWYVFGMNLRVLTYGCGQNVEQRWCDVCCRSISGGNANLLSHQASKAHKSKVQESKKKKPTAITNFFAPPPKPPRLAQLPLIISSPAPSASSSQIPAGTKDIIDIDALKTSLIPDPISTEGIAETDASSSRSIQDTIPTTRLSRLYSLTANLPQSIPIGNQNEPLGCFAVNPQDLILPGQDAWEDVIDPTFNRVIGFGKSTPEIAALIRRGEYGMDGFCNWTKLCIENLEISSLLLETRLDRVMQAMVHLYVLRGFLTLFAKIMVLSSGASEVPLVKTTTRKEPSR